MQCFGGHLKRRKIYILGFVENSMSIEIQQKQRTYNRISVCDIELFTKMTLETEKLNEIQLLLFLTHSLLIQFLQVRWARLTSSTGRTLPMPAITGQKHTKRNRTKRSTCNISRHTQAAGGASPFHSRDVTL